MVTEGKVRRSEGSFRRLRLLVLSCSDEPIPDWPRAIHQSAISLDKQAAKSKLAARTAGVDEGPEDDIKDEDMADADNQVCSH